MSDTTDIDIDAERKAYREWRIRVLRACGMYPGETDQRDTYRLDAWLARARIAAERERQLLDLLEYARFDECTKCYSDAVGLQCCYPHSDLCRQITAALKKGPSDGR